MFQPRDADKEADKSDGLLIRFANNIRNNNGRGSSKNGADTPDLLDRLWSWISSVADVMMRVMLVRNFLIMMKPLFTIKSS